MLPFETRALPAQPDALAPDGSHVRLLLRNPGLSMVHCHLPAGAVSTAVTHRTVEEVWYVVAGQGEIWRKQGEHEAVVTLQPGQCLTIPLGTHFQFRAASGQSVSVIVATAPPWPGDDEAIEVNGPWPATQAYLSG